MSKNLRMGNIVNVRITISLHYKFTKAFCMIRNKRTQYVIHKMEHAYFTSVYGILNNQYIITGQMPKCLVGRKIIQPFIFNFQS